MRTAVGALGGVVVLLICASVARAEDLEDESFSLRLAAAQSRFSRFTDAAGLAGAGAGSPWSSSPNPAAVGLNPSAGPRHLGASAQYAYMTFQAGTDVHVASLSGAWEGSGGWGNWQPSVLGLTSNRATTKDGLDFEWDAGSVEVQWGRELCCGTAFGVNVGFLTSEMTFDLGPLPASESTADTYTLRLGVLRKASEKLHIGLTVEGQASRSETTLYDLLGLGFGSMVVKDTTYGLLVRAGIYTFLTKDLTLYADYQAAWFEDDTGSLTTHRLSLGLDQTVIRGVYARVGTLLDAYGNAAFTAGIGVAPSERVFIDASFQYDMFPEISPEFGRGDTFGLGVTLLF